MDYGALPPENRNLMTGRPNMKIELADDYDREATFLSVDGRVIEIPNETVCTQHGGIYIALWPEQAVDKITQQPISDKIKDAIIEHIKTEMVEHRYELCLQDGTLITSRKLVDAVQPLGEESNKKFFQISFKNGYDSREIEVPFEMQPVDKNNPDKLVPKLHIGQACDKISRLPVEDIVMDAIRQHLRKEYDSKGDGRRYVALYDR